MAEYFRVERTEGFTVMSVYHLRDKTLSMRAKGLLSFILQLPPDWKFSTRGLAANMKDGVDAVTETLLELEHAGYIARRRLRDEKGHYKDTMYTIYEKPRSNGTPSPSGSPSPSSEASTPDSTSPDQESPDPGIPYQEIPDVGFPDEASPDADSPAQEKPALLSTNRPNTDISKKKRESTNASSMNQSNHYHIHPEKKADDDLDIDSIYETLKANFLYDSTVTDYNRDELDNILDIMVEMVCCQSRTLTISKVDQPIELVRKRVYQINYMTMQYILNSLEKTSTEPQDPKAYIMTVIFNAPVTKAVRDAPRIRNMLG